MSVASSLHQKVLLSVTEILSAWNRKAVVEGVDQIGPANMIGI